MRKITLAALLVAAPASACPFFSLSPCEVSAKQHVIRHRVVKPITRQQIAVGRNGEALLGPK